MGSTVNSTSVSTTVSPSVSVKPDSTEGLPNYLSYQTQTSSAMVLKPSAQQTDGWGSDWEDLPTSVSTKPAPILLPESQPEEPATPPPASPISGSDTMENSSREDRAAIMAKKKEERKARIEALKMQRKSNIPSNSKNYDSLI